MTFSLAAPTLVHQVDMCPLWDVGSAPDPGYPVPVDTRTLNPAPIHKPSSLTVRNYVPGLSHSRPVAVAWYYLIDVSPDQTR